MSGGDNTTEHQAVVFACRLYLYARSAWFLKVAGGYFQRAGIPDLLACLPPAGRLVAVEVKTGGAVLTTTQAEERLDLMEAGALYVLAHGVQDLEDALVEAGIVNDRILVDSAMPDTWAARHGRARLLKEGTRPHRARRT